MSIYGDGSDGTVVRSSNGEESGRIDATQYGIESGVTRTATGNNGITIIHATQEIDIQGTLRAVGASGGSGGAGNDSGSGYSGNNGGSADWINNNGSGGAGGSGSNGETGHDGSQYGGAGGGGRGGYGGGDSGGDGGDGGTAWSGVPSNTKEGAGPWRSDESLENKSGWSSIYDYAVVAGTGGAGGGGGGTGESPGNKGGDGGDGGDGGGIILLIAPEISISGTITVAGTDGESGDDGVGSGGSASGGGGGGGGGAGGVAYLVSETTPSISGTVDRSRGARGAAGVGPSNGHDGGVGAVGNSGQLHTHDVQDPTTSVTGTSTVSTTAGSSASVSTSATSSVSSESTASFSGTGLRTGVSSVATNSTAKRGIPVTATTALPDAQAPTLGNGVEDEIQVAWDDVIDNSEYNIEYRETGASTWLDGPTVDESVTSAPITGLEDGEEYEVRLRTETEHVTGSWTSPVSIVTKFPGVTSVASASTTATSVTVEGTDNADNEDGFRLEREERIEGEWRDRRVVAEQGANAGTGTISITDTTPSPGTTYRYRIEAYTEHRAGTSPWTSTVTTDSLDVPQTRTGSRSWSVRVEHTSSGAIHRPTTLDDDPTRTPSVNGLPEVRIPVPRNPKWTTPGFENAPIEVYVDGVREPVDTLVDVEVHPDKHVLVAQGGTELLEATQLEIGQEKRHSAAETLITSETSYSTEFDDPDAGPVSETLMQSAATTQEFQDALLSQPASTDPFEVTSEGEVEPLQVCWTREMENGSTNTAGSFFVEYASGTGVDDGTGETTKFAEAGEVVEHEFTTYHDIPAGSFEISMRKGIEGFSTSNVTEVEVSLDAELLGSFAVGTNYIAWTDMIQSDTPYLENDPGLVPAGTHTLRFEAIATNSTGNEGAMYFDAIAPRDTRYSDSFTFDNDVKTNSDGDNYLDGPGWYPDVPVEFEDAITDLAVTGGRWDGTLTNTSGGLRVELSDDQGSTWPISGSNTSTVEGDFPESGGSIRARVTLSAFGTASETPGQRRQPQSLNEYSLYADVDETPLVINQDWDARILDVLRDLAGDEFVFEVERDGSGGYRILWTQVGQRPVTANADVVDYNGTRTTREQVAAARVRGAAQSVGREEWTATLDEWVPLSYERLQQPSVSVWDPASGEGWERGVDFELDASGGRLKALSSGGMSDGAVYAVSYEWQTYGEYESPDASDARVKPVKIPELSSNRACGQAARRIVTRLQEPRYSAEVVVPTDEVGWSVINAVDVTQLGFPAGTELQVRGVETSPGEARFRLEEDSLGDVVAGIRDRVSAIADRV